MQRDCAPCLWFILFSCDPFPDRGEIDAAAGLTPALLVLKKMVLASEGSRLAVKRAIFPPEADEVNTRVNAYDAKHVNTYEEYEVLSALAENGS